MNNQDYEQKKRECWEDFCNEHLFDPHNIITQGIFGYAFDRAYQFGKEEKESEREDNLQARAWEALTPAMRTYCRNMRRTSHDGNVVDLLDRLFGPKCLPGGNSSNVDEIEKDCNVESSESKSAEPKFKVGDKVKDISSPHDDGVYIVDDIKKSSDGFIYHIQGLIGISNVNESDLEPYTEPDTSHETPVCENHSDNTSQKEVYVSSNRNLSQELANYDKQFDTILKDGFSKERRLNIAAMMAQAILTRVDDTPQVIADAAFRHADALIAESERRVK